MKIQEFIQGRAVNEDTVRKYIKRNPEIFSGHVGKSNNIVLDDYALDVLDQKYPFPEPVQIIEDAAARQELADLTDKMLLLHDRMSLLRDKYEALLEENKRLVLVEHDHKQLLEDKTSMENELELQRELNDRLQKENADLLKLCEELNEKRKSWWKRFGRKARK